MRPDRIRFKTENGSIYTVDYQLGTWKREVTTEHSGTIRAEGGQLLKEYDGRTLQVAVAVGCRAYLGDTAVLPGFDAHAVLTSRVTEILDVDHTDDGPEVNAILDENFPGDDEPFGTRTHLGGRFLVVHELEPPAEVDENV